MVGVFILLLQIIVCVAVCSAVFTALPNRPYWQKIVIYAVIATPLSAGLGVVLS